jgi:very-short-patch-repair endonuclease
MKHPPLQLARARDLRRRQTDAERLLWRHLRAGQVAGAKFRRQEPIGAFVVDFCCFDPKLIVEVDGGQHVEQSDADAQRSASLERCGFRIVRFWNNEVLANVDGVMERIEAVVASLREGGVGGGSAGE